MEGATLTESFPSTVGGTSCLLATEDIPVPARSIVAILLVLILILKSALHTSLSAFPGWLRRLIFKRLVMICGWNKGLHKTQKASAMSHARHRIILAPFSISVGAQRHHLSTPSGGCSISDESLNRVVDKPTACISQASLPGLSSPIRCTKHLRKSYAPPLSAVEAQTRPWKNLSFSHAALHFNSGSISPSFSNSQIEALVTEGRLEKIDLVSRCHEAQAFIYPNSKRFNSALLELNPSATHDLQTAISSLAPLQAARPLGVSPEQQKTCCTSLSSGARDYLVHDSESAHNQRGFNLPKGSPSTPFLRQTTLEFDSHISAAGCSKNCHQKYFNSHAVPFALPENCVTSLRRSFPSGYPNFDVKAEGSELRDLGIRRTASLKNEGCQFNPYPMVSETFITKYTAGGIDRQAAKPAQPALACIKRKRVVFLDLDDTLIPTVWMRNRMLTIESPSFRTVKYNVLRSKGPRPIAASGETTVSTNFRHKLGLGTARFEGTIGDGGRRVVSPYIRVRNEVDAACGMDFEEILCDFIDLIARISDAAVVVTNARSNSWLKVVETMFPRFTQRLAEHGITVNKTNPDELEEPNMNLDPIGYFDFWTQAKVREFSKVLERILTQENKNGSSDKSTCLDLVCVGDNEFEQCAFQQIVLDFPCCASARMIKCSSGLCPSLFVQQLRTMQKTLTTSAPRQLWLPGVTSRWTDHQFDDASTATPTSAGSFPTPKSPESVSTPPTASTLTASDEDFGIEFGANSATKVSAKIETGPKDPLDYRHEQECDSNQLHVPSVGAKHTESGDLREHDSSESTCPVKSTAQSATPVQVAAAGGSSGNGSCGRLLFGVQWSKLRGNRDPNKIGSTSQPVGPIRKPGTSSWFGSALTKADKQFSSERASTFSRSTAATEVLHSQQDVPSTPQAVMVSQYVSLEEWHPTEFDVWLRAANEKLAAKHQCPQEFARQRLVKMSSCREDGRSNLFGPPSLNRAETEGESNVKNDVCEKPLSSKFADPNRLSRALSSLERSPAVEVKGRSATSLGSKSWSFPSWFGRNRGLNSMSQLLAPCPSDFIRVSSTSSRSSKGSSDGQIPSRTSDDDDTSFADALSRWEDPILGGCDATADDVRR